MVLWDVIAIALLLDAGGPDAAKHRAPDRMPGFALVELEPGIELQYLAELLAALALLTRDAVHESQVLVGVDLIVLERQAAPDAALEQPPRVLHVPGLVGA